MYCAVCRRPEVPEVEPAWPILQSRSGPDRSGRQSRRTDPTLRPTALALHQYQTPFSSRQLPSGPVVGDHYFLNFEVKCNLNCEVCKFMSFNLINLYRDFCKKCLVCCSLEWEVCWDHEILLRRFVISHRPVQTWQGFLPILLSTQTYVTLVNFKF